MKANMTEVKYVDSKDVDYSRDKLLGRFETEQPESEELESLYNSIKIDGILEPIIVRPKGSDKYEAIAGNRRLRCAKRARLEFVPIIVKDVNEVQARRIAYIENVHRKDLSPIQKAKGIAAIYNDIGIPKEIAIIKVKRMHNTPISSTGTNRITESGNRTSDEANPTPEFLDAFKSIAIPANSQYKLLQLITALPEDVQKTAEETNLPVHKAGLLTHSKLKEHPTLQSMLAQKIQDKNVDFGKARGIVRQTIRDLETGALERGKTGEYRISYYDREQVSTKPEIDKTFDLKTIDYQDQMNKLIGKIIDRPIARGETYYELSVVKPKLDELAKKLSKIPKNYRDSFASTAVIMQLVCKTIVDSR